MVGGADFVTSGGANIGANGGSGSVRVDGAGSTWASNGTIKLGASGTSVGSMTISNGGDRFAAQIDIGGNGIDSYCFSSMLDGRVTLIQNGTETICAGANARRQRHRAGHRADDRRAPRPVLGARKSRCQHVDQRDAGGEDDGADEQAVRFN